MAEHGLGRIFTGDDASAGELLAWWEALDRDRGERAKLRRATTPVDAAFCASFHRLLAKLRGAGYPLGGRESDRLAAIAGLAAHAKVHSPNRSLAAQMASPRTAGGGARVSGLRFRRLLAVSDRDELYPLLIRVARLLDGSVNLVSLAHAVFWWDERTKKQWAYEYYAAAPSET